MGDLPARKRADTEMRRGVAVGNIAGPAYISCARSTLPRGWKGAVDTTPGYGPSGWWTALCGGFPLCEFGRLEWTLRWRRYSQSELQA
jgi:hypothetical protein